MPSCETIKMSNSKVNMSDVMVQMMKTLQEIFETLSLREDIVPNFHNFDHEDPYTIIHHDKINGEIQRELEPGDHGDKLNLVEAVSNPFDIATDVTVDVEVKDNLTTDIELQPK
ncbi:hypothetical protein PVK06_011998 [Gossypium arboreum]|uniref:Uncharacterized protein n=1 Tax=Gossypium arboreum TaxID=29729 RepID=A0ABR0QBH7_GOSAR|nr:hypothetical protein PVK06_011998 [Gossypium arboreum]